MAYNEFAYFYDEFNGEADYDALYSHIHSQLEAHGIRCLLYTSWIETMLIHLEKLGKSFGEKVVLHDVTASVEREDRIGIVGQNLSLIHI